MDKKPRYSVMLDGDRTVYSGNSRFVTGSFWLMNRHRRALSHMIAEFGLLDQPTGSVSFNLLCNVQLLHVMP